MKYNDIIILFRKPTVSQNGIKYTLGYHLNDVKLIVGIRSTYSMIQYGISGLGFIFYIIGIKCKVKEKDLTNQY